MNGHNDNSGSGSAESSRREFLQKGGTVTASVAVAAAIPPVHLAMDDTIRLGLIGCGGRGGGAVANALSVQGGPVELYAMGDLFEDKLNRSYRALSGRFKAKIAVSDDRKFLGFDAYKKVIDCLRPGDVVLCTTHAYCRPTHVEYAVKKGINVFMEKSFASDPAGLHRMLRNGELAEEKGVKIAAGLMCRHSPARQALMARVDAGELGDIHLIRAYRLSGGQPLGTRSSSLSELAWQIRKPGDFTWVGSGRFIEWLIHQIDECCWLKHAWPVEARGLGGRVPHSVDRSQNLDVYGIEYTFADGAKAMVDCRFITKCHNEFTTFAHGTKRAAQFSGQTHAGTVRLYKDQRITKDNLEWSAPKEPRSPWQVEWDVFLDNIRNGRPHNETQRAVYSDFAALMGRAAAHTGRIVTWDQMMNSRFQFCDDVDGMTFDSPAPVQPDEKGFYPVPIPGQWQEV